MSKSIRTIFVTPFYYPELRFGGPPKRLHAMARAFVAAGHQVSVITVDSGSPARTDSTRFDDISVQYLEWVGPSGYALPISLGALRSAISHADVVHCFGLYNFICPLATWVARREGKSLLLEPMGMFVPRNRSLATKTFYNATVTRWMARHAAAIVATSEIERVELLPLERLTKIVVRGNGINVEEFATLPPPAIMRERWHLTSDQKIVLYLGRISKKKQLRELIAAFLRLDHADTKLVIVGPVSEPDYADQLKLDIESSPRRKDISIEPALYGDDLKAALSAADLFVLPSLNENFGNSAAEAVAAGVPVLLTDTCGIASLIHERAGLAVPLGIAPFADGMRKMMDPETRDKMTSKREEVKRDLSWHEPIAQTIVLYENIIRRAKSGA